MAQVEHGCHTLSAEDLANDELEKVVQLQDPIAVQLSVKLPKQKRMIPWPCELDSSTITIPLQRQAHRDAQRKVKTGGPRAAQRQQRKQNRPKLPVGTIFAWTAYAND